MSSVVITPALLHGTVTPPPSKSAAHRAIICAALAKGKSRISPIVRSDDMEATIGAVKALGASVSFENDGILIDGNNTFSNISHEIDCLESGSTLRFLIPVAATSGESVTFTGKGRLPHRPIGPYLECLPANEAKCETNGGLPLTVSGKLNAGVFALPGDVSSQFITGLLLALPMLCGDSKVCLTTPLQSEGYIDLTMDIMKRFGVETSRHGQSFFVKGNQNYTPCNLIVEGDWSQAAFWLSADTLGGNVNCKGLDPNSKQGDMAVLDILQRFGANVQYGKDTVSAHGNKLHGCEIDASQIPDLVPVLAAVASLCEGQTVIGNAARLRLKESDRLATTAKGLCALGADITERKDSLVINGVPELNGGTADGANDHRIVMALAIAAQRCKNKVTITGSDCINKSYPAFFEHYNALGGCANVIDLG